jgi:hypothetical protein
LQKPAFLLPPVTYFPHTCRTYAAALEASDADVVMMGDVPNGNKPNVGNFILKPNQRVRNMLDAWLKLASPTKTEQFVEYPLLVFTASSEAIGTASLLKSYSCIYKFKTKAYRQARSSYKSAPQLCLGVTSCRGAWPSCLKGT